MDPFAPSYIERRADKDLLEALIAREYVFLLDSRQKGKSSMVARTIVRLKEAGVHPVKLDLQRIGANVTPEQWYAGMLSAIGEELSLAEALFEYWGKHQSVGPLARWIAALQHVMLSFTCEPIVIFIDEVDFVRALPFPTDEFFAGIRDCFNRRAEGQGFERLTFCIVGVTTPGQLIRNPEITPFNIGKRIELSDFSHEDLRPYACALHSPIRNGQSTLTSVHRWLNGHPFLSQLVCSRLSADGTTQTSPSVDDTIYEMFLTAESRQNEPNLADVERRLLAPDIPGLEPEEARTQVLTLLKKVHRMRPISYDSENPVIASLRLSGVAANVDGRLVLRNRLYRQIFSQEWATHNLPGAEQRRQRAAAWRAVLRTSFVATILLAIVGVLAVNAQNSARSAEKARAEAEYEAYASAMLSASQYWQDNNVAGIAEVVERHAKNPHKGWEWQYWSYVSRQHTLVDDDGKNLDFRWSRDGQSIICRGKEGIRWLDAKTGKTIRYFPSPSQQLSAAFETPEGRLLDISWGKKIDVWDIFSGRKLWSDSIPELYWRPNSILSPDGRFVVGSKAISLWKYDTRTRIVSKSSIPSLDRPSISPSGKLVAAVRMAAPASRAFRAYILDSTTLAPLASWPIPELPYSTQILPGDRYLVVGFVHGHLRIYDIKTQNVVWQQQLDTGHIWRMDLSRDGSRLSVATVGLVSHIFSVKGSQLESMGTIRGMRDAYWSPDGKSLLCFYNRAFVRPLLELEGAAVKSGRYTNAFIRQTDSKLIIADGKKLFQYNLLTQRPVAEVRVFGDDFVPDLRVNGLTRHFVLYRGSQAKLYDLYNEQIESTVVDFESRPIFYRKFKNFDKALVYQQNVGIGKSEPILVDGRGKTIRELNVDLPSSIMVSPSEDWVVFCGSTGIVTVWHTPSDTWRRYTDYAPFTLHDLEFVKDRGQIVASFDDGVAHLIDLSSGKSLQRFARHASNARSVALSTDLRRLATGGGDGTVRIWDFETGRLLSILRGHKSEVMHLRFVDQDRMLVSKEIEGDVLRWTTGPFKS